MRSNVAYLVVLMVMLACFAVFRLNPPGLLPMAGNWVLSAILLASAVCVALKRPFSFVVGLGGALCVSIGGLLSLRGYLGTLLPGHPVVWIVAGLYLAFRLTINHHAEQQKKE